VLVIDASALAEYVVASGPGGAVADLLGRSGASVHVPHLAVIETVSVLRAWVRRGELTAERAAAALEDLADLPAQRWPAEPLLGRVWELRENLSAYDATYVALAETIGADLVTLDRRLARALAGAAPGLQVIMPA
jgi:predicted nucleic acid-binding protein